MKMLGHEESFVLKGFKEYSRIKIGRVNSKENGKIKLKGKGVICTLILTQVEKIREIEILK